MIKDYDEGGCVDTDDVERERAKDAYRRALEADPDDVEALTGLAVLQLADEQLPSPESLALLERAFDLDRGDTVAFENLVNAFAEVADEEELDEVFREAAAAGNTEAVFELAARFDERGDVEEAETLYREAAEAGHVAALANLADLLDERGEHEKAETLFRQAVAAGRGTALNEHGRTLAKLHATERAASVFRRLINAGDGTAQHNLDSLPPR